MNARKHRDYEQATRDWLRLGPKGKRPGSGATVSPDANITPPVYRANLNHPVNIVEHGNAAHSARSRDRADLTARRVRGAALGGPKKPRPAVMRWICPRRSGLNWQERMRNRNS